MADRRTSWRSFIALVAAGFLVLGSACDFSRMGTGVDATDPDPDDPDDEVPAEPPVVQILAPEDGEIATGSRLEVHFRAQGDPIDRVTVRLSGSLQRNEVHEFQPAVANPDTVLSVSLGGAEPGSVNVQVAARTTRGQTGESGTVTVVIEDEIVDTDGPEARFELDMNERPRRDQPLTVHVRAESPTGISEVGVTIVGLDADGGTTVRTASQGGSEASFAFTAADFGVPAASDDESGWRLLSITGYARDSLGECAAVVRPDRFQAFPCDESGAAVVAEGRDGFPFEILTVRDFSAPVSGGDLLAHLATDGEWVFASNFSRNRVDYHRAAELEAGAATAWSSRSVGSEPWGLFVDEQTLFVANSGGTNISRLGIGPAGLEGETTGSRISTPNVRLFHTNVDDEGSVTGVVRHTYSDRPQFLGVTPAGRIFYSTKPTPAAPDGTIRKLEFSGPPGDDGQPTPRVEVFVDYAERTDADQWHFLIVNADSAFRVVQPGEDENDLLMVCATRVDTGEPTNPCPSGPPLDVRAALSGSEFDVRFVDFVDPEAIALQDTTFVGVSADRRTLAFGEGSTEFGRAMAFEEDPDGTLHRRGDTRDLIDNAAERITGLALNADGTLGAARGERVYMFDPELRLQGFAEALAPVGGIAMHPGHENYPGGPGVHLAFVPGTDAEGGAFLDIVDTFSFSRTRRLPLASMPTGAIVAVQGDAGTDFAIRVIGITAEGVFVVDLHAEDF